VVRPLLFLKVVSNNMLFPVSMLCLTTSSVGPQVAGHRTAVNASLANRPR
jgi:hypothetical protein